MFKSVLSLVILLSSMTAFAARLVPVTDESIKDSICATIAWSRSSGYYEQSACFEGTFFSIVDAAEETIVFAAKVPTRGFIYTGAASFKANGHMVLHNLFKTSFFSSLCTDEYTAAGMLKALSTLPSKVQAKDISFDIDISSVDYDSAPKFEGSMIVNGQSFTHNMKFKDRNCRY